MLTSRLAGVRRPGSHDRRIHHPPLRGPEKVRRPRQIFGEDVHLSAAYGNTVGDREMLEMADERLPGVQREGVDVSQSNRKGSSTVRRRHKE